MFAFILAVAAATQPVDAGPIAPALTGKVECYTADVARKTCSAIGAYTSNADGTFTNRAQVLIAPSPLIVMETAAAVRVVSGQVCGDITEADVMRSRLSVGGRWLSAEEARPGLQSISKSVGPIYYGKTVCTGYEKQADVILTKAYFDGVTDKNFDQRMIWVSPEDGYTVAP